MTVKLQVFEGPLDLLLHLLEKNKVNIYDIPIVEITNQYMEYIAEMKRQDLNVVSEFLVMAATLIDIKSRMLLPAPETEDEEEEDPRAELVQRFWSTRCTNVWHTSCVTARWMRSVSFLRSRPFRRRWPEYEEPVNMEELVSDVTLARLNEIFKSIMKKQVDKIDPIRSKFGKIEKEEVSLSDKMAYLENYCLTHSRFSFRSLP